MDEKVKEIKGNSESSLSESWNIVDTNEVNNISEGSDGESIEVIEEEGNLILEVNNTTQKTKDKNDSKVEYVIKKGGDNEVTTTACSKRHFLLDSEIDAVKENDAGVSSPVETFFSDGLNPCSVLGLIALLCAILFAGATFWVLLLRVEEIALDTFHYFIPARSQGSNGNSKDLDELMYQIKAYEEETENLKILVTDLTGAVENLKKELAISSKIAEKDSFSKTENKQHKDEDILYKELLKIHFGNKDNSVVINSSYEQVSKYVQELVSNLTSGQEHELNMESIKLFYQIPKYLAVLANFDDIGEDIDFFITSWKIRLNIVNEKIVEDMRSMQLKMMRNFLKQIKNMQRKFYYKLCNLSVMKKKECYKTFVNPYSEEEALLEGKSNDVELSETEGLDETLSDSNNNLIKNDLKEALPPTKDKSDNKQEKIKENVFKEEIINKQKKNLNEKGMENNLNTEPSTYDQINSFSSFSQDQGDDTDRQKETNFELEKDKVCEKHEGELQKKIKELDDFIDDQGTWFLEIGTQRSRLRKSQDRSNWLFDRARYRNGRKT